MKLKYYLRGMGIGIILTAIVMGFALGGRKAVISDEEIIARATALGMTAGPDGVLAESTVIKKEENNEKDTAASGEELDKEGKEISQEEHREVTLSDSPLFEVAQKEEAGEEQTSEKDNAASEVPETENNSGNTSKGGLEDDSEASIGTTIIDTVIPSEVKPAQEDIDVASAGDQETEESVAPSAMEPDESDDQKNEASEVKAAETAAASASTEKPKAAGRIVEIPGGSDSDRVAEILYNEGFIDSAITFNRYLVDTGQDRKLRSGTKTIPEGATYEQLAGILTSG